MDDIEKKLAKMHEVLVEQHPELKKALQQVEGKDLSEAIVALVPLIQKLSQEVDMQALMERSDVFFQPPVGGERLNPMYEAKIAERVQFDGDAPELRFGHLPKGASPAVPVETEATNPALIGGLLKKASQEVEQEMKLLVEDNVEAIVSTGLVPDPEGYKRGELPVPRSVGELSLLDMSLQEVKENTWHFISTTQGRKSAVPLIEKRLFDLIALAGFEPAKIHWSSEGAVLSEWLCDIASGKNATQGRFPYIEVVARVFFANLTESNHLKDDLKVKVISVDNITHRKVGWALLILEE